MGWTIIACEVGFWVFVATGLVARYRWRARQLGLVLLAMTPVLDLGLLVFTAVDLRRGGQVSVVHGIAAIYVGVSVAYGHKMIALADAWSAHRVGAGTGPVRRHAAAYAAECWRDVGRTLTSILIAATLFKALDLAAGVPLNAPGPLIQGFSGTLVFVFVVEAVWALSYTTWPKKPPMASHPCDGEPAP